MQTDQIKLTEFSEFKKQVQSIIMDYCEGWSYLEFSVDKFPEMLDRIEKEALRISEIRGSGEQLKSFEEWASENAKDLDKIQYWIAEWRYKKSI